MTKTPLSKLSGLATLVLISVSAFAQNRNVSISTFTSQEGRFRVEVPGQPVFGSNQINTAVGTITVYSYSVSSNGCEYAILYNDYPSVPSNPSAVIDAVGKSYLAGSQLIKQANLTLNGNPGHGYLFERGGYRYASAVYLVGSRLYQVMFQSPKSTSEPPELGRYFESFQIL